METARNLAEKTKQKEKEHTNKIEKEITNSQRTDNVKNQPNQILTISRCKQCLKGDAGVRGLPAEHPGLEKLRLKAGAAQKS